MALYQSLSQWTLHIWSEIWIIHQKWNISHHMPRAVQACELQAFRDSISALWLWLHQENSSAECHGAPMIRFGGLAFLLRLSHTDRGDRSCLTFTPRDRTANLFLKTHVHQNSTELCAMVKADSMTIKPGLQGFNYSPNRLKCILIHTGEFFLIH